MEFESPECAQKENLLKVRYVKNDGQISAIVVVINVKYPLLVTTCAVKSNPSSHRCKSYGSIKHASRGFEKVRLLPLATSGVYNRKFSTKCYSFRSN